MIEKLIVLPLRAVDVRLTPESHGSNASRSRTSATRSWELALPVAVKFWPVAGAAGRRRWQQRRGPARWRRAPSG